MQKEKHDKSRRERFHTHTLVEVLIPGWSAAAYRHPRQFWCLECLGKVAGYGGNSKANDPRFTCQDIKDTPGAANRVRRAWKSLRLTKNLDGSPFQFIKFPNGFVTSWMTEILKVTLDPIKFLFSTKTLLQPPIVGVN